jgi:hypothetical protein
MTAGLENTAAWTELQGDGGQLIVWMFGNKAGAGAPQWRANSKHLTKGDRRTPGRRYPRTNWRTRKDSNLQPPDS